MEPKPDESYADIRAAVHELCPKFPGEYWRKLDQTRTYPSEFVEALTQAGVLAALIPEEYGGSRLPMSRAAALLEDIQGSWGNGAAGQPQPAPVGARDGL